MKNLRSIFLWSSGLLYGLVFSIITILLSYLIPVQKLDKFIRVSLKLLFKFIFVKVKVEGNSHLDTSKTYLLMANHVSLFDVPLLKAYIPIYFKGIEAHHQFNWPFYGWLIKRLETIPIQRDNIFSSMRSMKKAMIQLNKGISVVILPEGGRTTTGEMMPFKKMPFMLAKKTGVNIVPIGLSGLYKVKSKGNWHITPSTISINFGNPISSEEIANLSLEELLVRVQTDIRKLISEP